MARDSAKRRAWIDAVSGAAGTQPLSWPWQRLLLDQPLLRNLEAR